MIFPSLLLIPLWLGAPATTTAAQAVPATRCTNCNPNKKATSAPVAPAVATATLAAPKTATQHRHLQKQQLQDR